jgi:nucleoside-diphosphate-sugar epimerase
LTERTEQPIAITGVTGFIGRNVARILAAGGQPWRGLVRDRRKLALLGLGGGEIIDGELADRPSLARLCSDVSAVIHCGGTIAAFSRQDFSRVNVEGTARLLDACRTNGVSRFIHVSSIVEREPQLSDYAASKRESEHVVCQSRGTTDMACAIVRPPAVYGPGDEATIPLIRSLTQSYALLPGGPSSRVSLLHVEDLARALASLALDGTLASGPFEIDDGKKGGYSFAELASLASAVTGTQVRVIFLPRSMLFLPASLSLFLAHVKGSPTVFSPGKLSELYHPNWVADSALSTFSGWKPRIDFSTGFADTLEWYRKHGWVPEGQAKLGAGRAGNRGLWGYERRQ